MSLDIRLVTGEWIVGFDGTGKQSVNYERATKQAFKAYQVPQVTKLNQEAALAKLRAQASLGNAGAQEFLSFATELIGRQK